MLHLEVKSGPLQQSTRAQCQERRCGNIHAALVLEEISARPLLDISSMLDLYSRHRDDIELPRLYVERQVANGLIERAVASRATLFPELPP